MIAEKQLSHLGFSDTFVIALVNSLVRFLYDLILYRWGLKLLLRCRDDVISLAT